jgi:hypothetical protein
MSSIKLTADSGGGTFEIKAPSSSANTRVLTLPDIAGTLSTVTGLTMCDQWRINSNFSFSNNSAVDITANWERNDNTGYGPIGSAMTESSGIFNFPITGKYLIMAYAQFYASSGAHQAFGVFIHRKIGSGGSFENVASGHSSGYTTNAYAYAQAQFLMDVTDTTNDQVKMQAIGNTSRQLLSSSVSQRTGFTFLRLGDT